MSVSGGNHRLPWRVTEVAETGSTNADLLVAAQEGAPDRSVLRADHQVSGRGRLGRVWEAPAGSNLLMSVLFRTVPAHPHALTKAVALSALDAAARVGVRASLKWPNDLLVEERKLAGILAQAGSPGGSGSGSDGAVPAWVVVGLGLNVHWAPEGATSLAAEARGNVPSPSAVMHLVLEALAEHLERDADDLHRAYRSELATLGSEVKVDLADGSFVLGTATDVEIDGRLVVTGRDGSRHLFSTGDVAHLRPQ